MALKIRRKKPSRRKSVTCAYIPIGGHDRLELSVRFLSRGGWDEQARIKTFPGREKPRYVRWPQTKERPDMRYIVTWIAIAPGSGQRQPQASYFGGCENENDARLKCDYLYGKRDGFKILSIIPDS